MTGAGITTIGGETGLAGGITTICVEPWISEGVNFTFVRKASQVFDAVLEKEAEK